MKHNLKLIVKTTFVLIFSLPCHENEQYTRFGFLGKLVSPYISCQVVQLMKMIPETQEYYQWFPEGGGGWVEPKRFFYFTQTLVELWEWRRDY